MTVHFEVDRQVRRVKEELNGGLRFECPELE